MGLEPAACCLVDSRMCLLQAGSGEEEAVTLQQPELHSRVRLAHSAGTASILCRVSAIINLSFLVGLHTETEEEALEDSTWS